MRREQAYGNSVRELKRMRDDLLQGQADLETFEDEIETEYAKVCEQQEMLTQQQAECDRIRAGLTSEMRNHNPLHPSLNAQQTLHREIEAEAALLVRMLPPRIKWDEKNDRASVTIHYSNNGLLHTEVYAMSLGELDYIDEMAQEGFVKETANKINRELWAIIKKRNKT